MFLETLLCARDRLVLSYLGRDEVTGEKRPPSAVLLELREILSSGYLTTSINRVFSFPSARTRSGYKPGVSAEVTNGMVCTDVALPSNTVAMCLPSRSKTETVRLFALPQRTMMFA